VTHGYAGASEEIIEIRKSKCRAATIYCRHILRSWDLVFVCIEFVLNDLFFTLYLPTLVVAVLHPRWWAILLGQCQMQLLLRNLIPTLSGSRRANVSSRVQRYGVLSVRVSTDSRMLENLTGGASIGLATLKILMLTYFSDKSVRVPILVSA